jgi:cysteinyl-tRNA synthetase
MSMKYLGDRFDVHTGGVDHIPVHHTNEIAQSEAYLGGPWVPFWVHNEFINLRDAKMSKSKGDTVLLSDLQQRGFHPLSYRYLLLGSRYRTQAEFTWDGLEGARVAHRRLLERTRERLPAGGRPLGYHEAADRLGDAGRGYLSRFDEAVSADLNTPQALAVLTQLSRDRGLARDDLAVLVSAAEALLAIGLLDLAPDDLDAPAAELALSPDEVDRLLGERTQARRRGDFAAADAIRDRLDRLGIELRDTPEGTVWKTHATDVARRRLGQRQHKEEPPLSEEPRADG